MADDIEKVEVENAKPIFNNTLLAIITVMVLAFNAVVIVLATWKGDPANSLHTSAQQWSYVFGGGILAGLGIGKLSTVIELFKR